MIKKSNKNTNSLKKLLDFKYNFKVDYYEIYNFKNKNKKDLFGKPYEDCQNL